MPPRDWRFRITDILQAINTIREYVSGLDFVSFAADRRTVDAVVRNLIIIGEAATWVPDDVVRRHPEIAWSEMRAMRNLIVHEYFGVSDRIVWDTTQCNLPSLVTPLDHLLTSAEE